MNNSYSDEKGQFQRMYIDVDDTVNATSGYHSFGSRNGSTSNTFEGCDGLVPRDNENQSFCDSMPNNSCNNAPSKVAQLQQWFSPAEHSSEMSCKQHTVSNNHNKSTAHGPLIILLLFISALSCFFGILVGPFIDSASVTLLRTTVTNRDATYNSPLTIPVDSTVKILIYNEYTDASTGGSDASTVGGGKYKWDSIVEPYRKTFLRVVNPVYGCKYIWYLDGWRLNEGETISMTFTAPTGKQQTVSLEVWAPNRMYSGSINRETGVFTTTTTTSSSGSGSGSGTGTISIPNIPTVGDEFEASSTSYTTRFETNGLWLVQTKHTVVMCKYVRRELRTLLEQDRVAFFSAMSIMQRMPTQTGQLLYGKQYFSKDYFNRIHLYYGGSRNCDHWHQGPGFVVSHFALTLQFEQALQAINPSIALPYWDFTLESTFYAPNEFRDSVVFSPDWFSDAKCENALHTPLKGRFALNKVMRHAVNFSDLISPYGMLRSPWNADPTPYMSRSALIYGLKNNLKPSGCTEYHRGMKYRDWMSLAKILNAAAHGHIHELMGGSWSYDDSALYRDKKVVSDVSSTSTSTASSSSSLLQPPPLNTSGYSSAYEFAHATEAYAKILWRYGYVKCPEVHLPLEDDDITDVDFVNGKICNANTPPSLEHHLEKCTCRCTDEARSRKPYELLFETGISSGMVFYDQVGNSIPHFTTRTKKDSNGNVLTVSEPYAVLPGYSAAESNAIYSEILDVVCSIGHIGDMFQATSTNDVTFWVLHPTVERLHHLMRLNAADGLIDFNDTWVDGDITCSGHFSYSVQPFKNLLDNKDVLYTNARLYELLHPNRAALPYIYDHFRWSHCTALGFNMTGLDS